MIDRFQLFCGFVSSDNVHECLKCLMPCGFDQDILVGLLRLRKCGRNTTCPELMGKCSMVRELHVYGTAVPVHGRDADKLQHQVIHISTSLDQDEKLDEPLRREEEDPFLMLVNENLRRKRET